MPSVDVLINQLNFSSTIIVVGLSIINFMLGGIGLILNIIVFSRPALRRETCSLYFFSSTCLNLFVIFIILPVRIVSEGFSMDLANYNIGICKTEIFAFYVTRTISCWLIVLACFDRYLHSSPKVHIRQLSSLKTTKRIIPITSIVIIILYSHMIIYYEITNASDQFGNITPMCYGQKGIYRTFVAFWYLTLYSLCPSFLMFVFGFLTLNNLRQSRQVVPRLGEPNQIVRRRDNQLLRMLVAQVLVIVISTLPSSIYRLYASFTLNLPKDTLRRAQENLFYEIAATMTYFAHSSSFYFYTLTGTVFRQELIKFLRRCYHPNGNIRLTTQTGSLQMSILNRTQLNQKTNILSKH